MWNYCFRYSWNYLKQFSKHTFSMNCKHEISMLCPSIACCAFKVWKEPNGAARACTANRQCPATHYCTPVTTWTGSVYQTKSLCCPSKNYVCSQPRDVGVRCSSTRITRHYFSADTKTCQVFQYNGCEGNLGENFHLLTRQWLCTAVKNFSTGTFKCVHWLIRLDNSFGRL